jgi:sec-independent protein translocase protein TatB
VFGIGGSEILVILIVALLFLGPDKMPDAARQISKGIRQLKRGSREIQQTLENDETIGGALRDLKGALRGEDPVPRPKKKKVVAPVEIEADEPEFEDHEPVPLVAQGAAAAPSAQLELPTAAKTVKLPPEAGEADPDHREGEDDRAELAKLIRPASGTVAKSEAIAPAAAAEPAKSETEPDKHG